MQSRIKGVSITPHNCKIQDKDEEFYMQFNIVVCGLDSIEARRWINSMLVDLVDNDNPETLKPLIDGGTEGIVYHPRNICYMLNSAQDLRGSLGSFSRQ